MASQEKIAREMIPFEKFGYGKIALTSLIKQHADYNGITGAGRAISKAAVERNLSEQNLYDLRTEFDKLLSITRNEEVQKTLGADAFVEEKKLLEEIETLKVFENGIHWGRNDQKKKEAGS